jgi:hypothetical protein
MIRSFLRTGPSSCTSSRSSADGQLTLAARARLRYPLTEPWLSLRLLTIARCDCRQSNAF